MNRQRYTSEHFCLVSARGLQVFSLPASTNFHRGISLDAKGDEHGFDPPGSRGAAPADTRPASLAVSERYLDHLPLFSGKFLVDH